MATQSSIRKPKDTLEKPIPDSSIPYIDFKTVAKQSARNSLQFYKKKVSIDLYYYDLSLKRVELNFCPGSTNSIIGKNPENTARCDRIISKLCHFYKVSLIKTGLMFHKYHFHEIQTITKMSFNIPLTVNAIHCITIVSQNLFRHAILGSG